MKKLLLFLCAVLGIVGFSGKDLYTFNSNFGGEYVAYVKEGDTLAFSVAGEGVYYTDDYNSAADAGIIAETITLSAAVQTDTILNALGSIYSFEDESEDTIIIYGYSPMLKRVRFVNNRPVNFQITRSASTVTVSTPVNVGSF